MLYARFVGMFMI